MAEAESFEQAALVEIHARGVEKAETVCAVSDGAEWIPKFVDNHRPNAVRILDFAHAVEYVAQAGQAAHEHLPSPAELTSAEERSTFQQTRLQQWLREQRRELKAGAASKVLDEVARLQRLMQESQAASAAETISKKLSYLTNRRAMLDYASFRAQGYPIGSGSVESANKLVVQSRMKGAGMRWGPEHVNPMLALRNLACNDRWEQGWQAIRQLWQHEAQAKRDRRACRPAPQTASEPAPVPATAAPSARSRRAPARVTPPKPQAQPVAGERAQRGPKRPAASHPWRRSLLPRRSA
jgi:hypothetical protein